MLTEPDNFELIYGTQGAWVFLPVYDSIYYHCAFLTLSPFVAFNVSLFPDEIQSGKIYNVTLFIQFACFY